MSWHCRGLCDRRHKYKVPRYDDGEIYCSVCEICMKKDEAIESNGLRCYCCNSKVRTKANNSRSVRGKERLEEYYAKAY